MNDFVSLPAFDEIQWQFSRRHVKNNTELYTDADVIGEFSSHSRACFLSTHINVIVYCCGFTVTGEL